MPDILVKDQLLQKLLFGHTHTHLTTKVVGNYACTRLGYLGIPHAKSEVIFLLGDLDFYKGDEISRLSVLVFEI